MNRRIEICGGIASGKTTLAHALEEYGFTVVYERIGDNPFLNDFYTKKDVDNTFETEITFTLLHYNWIKSSLDSENVVCDYSLFQDFCYGLNNLNRNDWEAYRKIYTYLLQIIPPFDMLIYLKCSTDCLMERIRLRNREMEQVISKDYLENNISVIEDQLSQIPNVLVIDSERYNFVDKDKKEVVNQIISYYKGNRIV